MARARKDNVHRLEFLHRDRGYRFADRDPQLEELCRLIYASEMSVNQIVEAVAKATRGAYRVSPSTIGNWLAGKVKRPQNFTLTWVGFALGYERKWVKF